MARPWWSSPSASCRSTRAARGRRRRRRGRRGCDELWERMWASSVDVGGPLVDRLAKACADRGIHIAIGVNEREDDRPGSLYNTLLVIGPEGVLHRHRKLMPTMHERVFHGVGAGDDLGVVELPGRRPGGRAHLLGEPNAAGPLARCTRAARRSGWRRRPTTATAGSPSMRHIAIEAGAFVVSVPQFIPAAAFPDDFPLPLPDGVERLRARRRLHRVARRRGHRRPAVRRRGDRRRRLRPARGAARQALLRRRRPLQPARAPGAHDAVPGLTRGPHRRRVAGAAHARAVRRAARGRDRARLDGRAARRGPLRPLHVRRLRRRAVPERHEVRLGLRLAELLRLRRAAEAVSSSKTPGWAMVRTEVRCATLRLAPRPRVPRRVRHADRRPLLHELGRARLHPGLTAPDPASGWGRRTSTASVPSASSTRNAPAERLPRGR